MDTGFQFYPFFLSVRLDLPSEHLGLWVADCSSHTLYYCRNQEKFLGTTGLTLDCVFYSRQYDCQSHHGDSGVNSGCAVFGIECTEFIINCLLLRFRNHRSDYL